MLNYILIIFLFQITLFKCDLTENKTSEKKSSIIILSNYTEFHYNKIKNLVVFGYNNFNIFDVVILLYNLNLLI